MVNVNIIVLLLFWDISYIIYQSWPLLLYISYIIVISQNTLFPSHS